MNQIAGNKMKAVPSKDKKRYGLRERKKHQTRQALLSVAHTLFADYDFADVTIEQIVEKADVSPKTFFNYFQNKAQFLEQYLLDWLKGIGFWAYPDSPIEDCRSSLIPSDFRETIDWIIENRRILKMAMQHTDFLNFIYKLEPSSTDYDPELNAAIRRPRVERVMRGQLLGVVRKDLSADQICNMYDALRIDTVRRWLYLPDEQATAENLRADYEVVFKGLIEGVQA